MLPQQLHLQKMLLIIVPNLSSNFLRVRKMNGKTEIILINLLIIKPFFLIKEKETDECDEDTEFTAPLITAFFGRYDNESPPLLMFF